MDFASLDLPEPVMQGIREAGFVKATPIQEAALPLALRGKDVAGQSQTGTGKTAAFLIAAFAKMLRTPAPPAPAGTGAPRMLVIAPTRELVVQIDSDARLLGRFTPFRTLAVYGGIDYAKQRDALAAGCDLLVGTPGRLIDYLKQRVWTPRRVEILVIDEADRMFDMGFIADLRFILRRLPPQETRALTGDVDQKRRLKILNDFKEGRLPILVATDVASRGLHIEAVSHVVNWDLPQDAEDYVHRIGRTARAGAGGKAIGLVDESSALALEAIEKFIGQKIAVEWADDDLFMPEIKPTAEERRRYADERRARLAARDRFGDRDRGRRGGGGRPHGRPHPEPPPAGRSTPAPPPPPPPPQPAEGASGPRRRRRRRGRGRSGPRPEGSPPLSERCWGAR